MAALDESLSGVWPENKMIEVNNAMRAALSRDNGARNFSGVIIGSFIYKIQSIKDCLKITSKSF
jgi:hypothetical protein